MRHRRVRRTEQQRRDAIGHDAVDLFRHAAVERSQTRLDVRHGLMELDRRERARHRRIGVAVDQHPVRRFVD